MDYYTVNGNDKWTHVSIEHYTYKIHATIKKTIQISRKPWNIRLLFERIFYRTISLYWLYKDYNSVDFYRQP